MGDAGEWLGVGEELKGRREGEREEEGERDTQIENSSGALSGGLGLVQGLVRVWD